MKFETILVENVEKGICRITLNRPEKLNAVNPKVGEEFVAALEKIDQDDDIRVVIITGAGRAFSSGGDVTGFPGGGGPQSFAVDRNLDQMRRMVKRTWQKVIVGLQKLEKPTIAMVNGVAVGGGFDLALACDMRIGSENARFMVAFIRRGLIPDFGGSWLLPRAVGIGKACEILFTGDFVEAQEAEKIGILNRLVPADDLESETMKLARKIASGPPLAIRLAKLSVYKGLQVDLETQMEWEIAHQSFTVTSQDFKESVSAFMEKRPPQFTGE